jgi:hypothetical protein
MTKPDSHTLVMLREISADILQVAERLDRKIDTAHLEFEHQIVNLAQTVAGETAKRVYAMSRLKQRLVNIERRIIALEDGPDNGPARIRACEPNRGDIDMRPRVEPMYRLRRR